jgi:hypothetical protein
MPKPRRKGSTITLKYTVTGSEKAEYAISKKIKDYADEVRDRFFDLYYDAVREFAEVNNEEGRAHTGTDRTGRLFESITRNFSDPNTLHIFLDYNTAPYAWIRNLPEGEGVFIYPKRAKTLKFFWHRKEMWVQSKFVFSPGSAFFSRAWFSALAISDELLERAKEEVRFNG